MHSRFDAVVAALRDVPGVAVPTSGSGFGSGALRLQKTIFAMQSDGCLVVKLPSSRVAELVDAGHGVHYDANRGKPMKQWLRLAPDSDLDWLELAREALLFVTPRR